MQRRKFITLFGGATMAWPFVARAQQPNRKRLVGVLMAYAESDASARSMFAAFRDALAKLGWTEGSNLRIELRSGAGNADKIKTFTKELVDLQPDVILCQGTAVTGSLVRETRTVSIVFVNVADPIGSGFVTSVARPGGNVSGFMLDISAQGGKWIELLKEIAPRTTHVALLLNPATGPSLQLFMPSIQAAASSFAVEVSTAQVQAKEEIEGVIAAQARDPGGGLVVIPSAFSTVNRELIIGLAAQYGVPAIYFDRFFTDSGGLIAYSPDYTEHFRPAADYVDRILKGVKPADLPVQAPTKFELFINLKTATTLGLTVAPSMLARADEVIE
jgi:putative ABC transport system substrate-binding protein